jgi:GGDEF domain-containing protein
MTASIGVATLGDDGNVILEDASSLMRSADAAMYYAKRSGKNTVAHARS